MDLFDSLNATPHNILPYDGLVLYYGRLLGQQQADEYFAKLFDRIAWQHDRAMIMGKMIITRRKAAWYGDMAFSYRYSGFTKTALPWTKELLELKALVEQTTAETYNSCLLNLYHDGSEGMTWHSDGEKELKKQGAIASLSLGASRKFSFKHKHTQESLGILLEHGSLLVMKGETQSHWLHALPISKKITAPRINLTFRSIVSKI